jgi:hypothetical protein
MGKSGSLSGGGIEGNKVKHTSNPKREPVASAISVGAVSRLGGMVGPGTQYKQLHEGPGNYTAPVGPSTHMGQGPGANREILKSGSQGQHGPSAGGQARPSTPDIFKSFPGKK